MANTAQTDVLLLGSRVGDGTFTRVTSGTSVPLYMKTFPLASIYIDADGGTISTGTLLIEQAWWDPLKGDMPYGGLWGAIQSITLSTLSGTAQQQPVNISAISHAWLRVRLSVAITGGGKIFVAATAVGNS